LIEKKQPDHNSDITLERCEDIIKIL